MKYPTITAPYLPNLYKQSKKVLALHIEYSDDGFLCDDADKQAWLKHCIEQFYEAVESNFTTCTASRVFTRHGTVVVFKDNLTKQLLYEFVENLLAEISGYCEHHITLSYQLTTAVLMQEGVPAKMTIANKLGEELLDSPAGNSHMVTLSKERKARGKYFRSYEEYQHSTQKAAMAKQQRTMKQPLSSLDTKAMTATSVRTTPAKEEQQEQADTNTLEVIQQLSSHLTKEGQEKVITYIQDLHERYKQ